MACYIISYDLTKPVAEYEALIKDIKKHSKWAKVNKSVWAVVTDRTAVQIRDNLKTHLDADDRLFVIKSGVEAAWFRSICDSEWLKENL